MSALPTSVATSASPTYDALIQRASSFADKARSNATVRAYRSDWTHFASWCCSLDLIALPASPSIVGLYLASHADTLSIATLTRRLSAIATCHRRARYQLDTKHASIRDTMRGMRRVKGVAQRQAAAMTVPVVRQIAETCTAGSLLDVRDRALILVGIAGALRRSEIVELEMSDLQAVAQGFRIIIRRSKGDQEGAGQAVQIGRTGRETCPCASIEAWIEAAGIRDGKVFRSIDRHGNVGGSLSTRSVALIVQKRTGLAGLDASTFSGHSMRAGFATSAAHAGLEERDIARQTRHRSMTVLRRYIRDGEMFRRNLAADIGL